MNPSLDDELEQFPNLQDYLPFFGKQWCLINGNIWDNNLWKIFSMICFQFSFDMSFVIIKIHKSCWSSYFIQFFLYFFSIFIYSFFIFSATWNIIAYCWNIYFQGCWHRCFHYETNFFLLRDKIITKPFRKIRNNTNKKPTYI